MLSLQAAVGPRRPGWVTGQSISTLDVRYAGKAPSPLHLIPTASEQDLSVCSPLLSSVKPYFIPTSIGYWPRYSCEHMPQYNVCASQTAS